MVFSNPNVVRRVNEEFIPVALKAAMVNNPPGGIEGRLYAEIGRSKPAPQGICSTNSAGKVLAWTLSFDDDQSILKFLDHVQARYRQFPDAKQPVTAERYRKFPSRKLEDVKDKEIRLFIPSSHARKERCPAQPLIEQGTLVGRMIGRALDEQGQPVADTIRQEHYMEARVQIPVSVQKTFVKAMERAGGRRFQLPDSLAEFMVSSAFLGQLDVNPCGGVPGSKSDRRDWEFRGFPVDADGPNSIRIRIEGRSDVEAGHDIRGIGRGDDRFWEHRVTLHWQGYADVSDGRIIQLAMLASGHERLRWGNAQFQLLEEADVEHLMAGHPIDLECGVRYGLFLEGFQEEEIIEPDAEDR